MSYTELHIGTLKEIDLGELTIEDWCKSKCDELELELYNEDYDWKYYSYLELLLDTHPEYKVFHNKLYICNDKELGDGEINKVIKNPDGSISYTLQFYNGGACLDDMLEVYLEDIK